MNHYQTLGVDREATPDAIKAAFRRRAKSAHPDREGGSASEMAAVNRAYEVLSDLVRRAHFDKTGSDTTGPSQETKAREMLMQLFVQVLSKDGDIVAMVRSGLAQIHASATNELASLQRSVGRLQSRRLKVHAEKGDNLVHMVIDQQLLGLNAQVEHHLGVLKTVSMAEDILGNYRCDLDIGPTIYFQPTRGAFI